MFKRRVVSVIVSATTVLVIALPAVAEAGARYGG
jgi:hypothetical protein